MKLFCNIIWVILGGWISALEWLFAGLICCLTVVGIPFGLQCFKMAGLTLAPFGKEIVHGGGAAPAVGNVIWCLTIGWVLALSYVILGVGYCVTIIGIPVGLQAFKMASLSFAPFGAEVVD